MTNIMTIFYIFLKTAEVSQKISDLQNLEVEKYNLQSGALGQIRTAYLRLRRATLYPDELLMHKFLRVEIEFFENGINFRDKLSVNYIIHIFFVYGTN